MQLCNMKVSIPQDNSSHMALVTKVLHRVQVLLPAFGKYRILHRILLDLIFYESVEFP